MTYKMPQRYICHMKLSSNYCLTCIKVHQSKSAMLKRFTLLIVINILCYSLEIVSEMDSFVNEFVYLVTKMSRSHVMYHLDTKALDESLDQWLQFMRSVNTIMDQSRLQLFTDFNFGEILLFSFKQSCFFSLKKLFHHILSRNNRHHMEPHSSYFACLSDGITLILT